MFKINLIPEVKQEQIRVKRLNLIFTSVGIGTAVTIAVIAIILSGYIFTKKTQISSIQQKTDKINSELEVYKDLEQTVLTLETGLKEINGIINGGSKWSKFFVELEKVTPQDIQITSFSIKSGQITMELLGKNVQSVDRFVKSYTDYKVSDQNLFSNVKVTGYSDKDGKVTFQATMNLVGGILW